MGVETPSYTLLVVGRRPRLVEALEADASTAVDVHVTEAVADGISALHEDLAAVVTTPHLPDGTGRDVLEAVREKEPTLPVILATAGEETTVDLDEFTAIVTDHVSAVRLAARIRPVLVSEASEERIDLFERVTDGVIALDTEWRFTYVNRKAAALFGAAPGSLIGESIWEVYPEATSTPFYKQYLDAAERQVPRTIEEHFEPWDQWFREHLYPSDNGMTVIFRDITEERRRIRDLERAQRRFEAVFEDPNLLVGQLTVEGEILEVNSTAVSFTDVTADRIRGTHLWDSPWFAGDETLAREAEALVTAGRHGEYVSFELDHTPALGSPLVVDGVLRPVTDDGEVVSLLISGHEVTARHRRERQLEVMDRLLRHNFRTEMTLIMGYAETIAESGSDSIHDHASAIVSSGESLLRTAEKQREIIQILLEGPEPKPVDLDALVGSAVETCRLSHREIDVDYADASDPVMVEAIPQVEFAIRELVENAIEHAIEPAPTVAVEPDESTICVTVSDTCQQLSAEDRSVLLGEGETDQLFHGGGIGLWLVDWVVTRSNGTISYRRGDTGNHITVCLSPA